MIDCWLVISHDVPLYLQCVLFFVCFPLYPNFIPNAPAVFVWCFKHVKLVTSKISARSGPAVQASYIVPWYAIGDDHGWLFHLFPKILYLFVPVLRESSMIIPQKGDPRRFLGVLPGPGISGASSGAVSEVGMAWMGLTIKLRCLRWWKLMTSDKSWNIMINDGRISY